MQHKWTDITFDQYKRCVCTSYTGGSTWFSSTDFPGVWLVLHGSTPRDAQSFFLNNPQGVLTVEEYSARVTQ